MITKLALDWHSKETRLIRAGMPLAIISDEPRGFIVELADGRETQIPGDYIEAGHVLDNIEHSLAALAKQTGIPKRTLQGAAKEGRLLARQSGHTWLTTRAAIDYWKANDKRRKPAIDEIEPCPECGFEPEFCSCAIPHGW